jgi:long-chain acyl-CoA synthetase
MPRYSAPAVLELIEKERITRLPAGPTVFIGLLNDGAFAATDFSSLRTAYSGSAPLPEETLRRWRERTGSPIFEGYGQTEAGPVLTYIRDGGDLKVGSSGPALPLTEIEIVDVETGKKTLGTGEIGEIRARGPQIMSGYRNKPEETAEALRDGWLYTGDIGELDADGYIYIRDRKKDMAIVGGYNVYPREVEEVLFTHPDVKEAASAGVPDPYYGETIRAHVVLKPGVATTADDLVAHCKANLARYKVPSRIDIVDALPRTVVGKVDRVALRGVLASQRPVPPA